MIATRFLILLWIFHSISINVSADQKILTLDDYRKQVELNDPAYRGAVEQVKAVQDARLAKDAATDTKIFFNFVNFDDQRPTQNPNFQGTSSGLTMYSLGLEKQTEWGPSFSVSHNIAHSITREADPNAIPEPDYYDVFPEFKATVPLWRNLLGGVVRSELRRKEAETDLLVLQTDIQMSEAKSNLEMAFFTYHAHRESLKLHSELLLRAQKVLDWVQGQRRRGLVDEADVHQAQAAVTLRRLDLENIQRECVASARRLNDLRGVPDEVVHEELLVPPLDLEKLKHSYDASKWRKDILAAQAQQSMQGMSYRTMYELSKPQLDFVFRGDWVGRDRRLSAASEEFSEGDQTYYYAGLQFSMPLNASKQFQILKGYERLSEGQYLIQSTKDRDLKSAWREFVDLGERLRVQIALLRELENIQKAKSNNERSRFQRGRSTTFQVLNFEQDYISARTRLIAVELEARRYITQLELYK